MRRVINILALGLCLLGCSSGTPGEPVELATIAVSVQTCHPYPYDIVHLSVDPTAGIVARRVDGSDGNLGATGTVVWPSGHFGRRAGSEVVVYDENGTEKARTGRAYVITSYTGYTPGSTVGQVVAACISPWEGDAALD